MRGIRRIKHTVSILPTQDEVSLLQLIQFVLQGARTNASPPGKRPKITGPFRLIEELSQYGLAGLAKEDGGATIHIEL